MIQKRFNFGGAYFHRMSFAIKQHVLPNPLAIGVFDIATEVRAAADDGNLVKQTGTLTP